MYISESLPPRRKMSSHSLPGGGAASITSPADIPTAPGGASLTRHHWDGTLGLAGFLAVLPLGLDGFLQLLDLLPDPVQDPLRPGHVTRDVNELVWREARILPEFYLQDSDVGGEDCVHRLLDVGVLFLHTLGVLAHHGIVG